ELVSQVQEELGGLDILVNNAGITRDKLLMRMGEDDFDRVLEVNLKGTWNFCKAACRPLMKARGRIVNITSVVGLTGNAGQANYAASKAGMIGLTKTTAKELAGKSIRCNAVAPGFIQTEMTDVLPQQAKDMALAQIPLKRFGQPADIACAVAFLARDESNYITGQVLSVDGGMHT
ncbi:MAG: SDR family oxidoreductase, partial [Phycisphaerae bacterium]|nr:SDR family oxidoreductase [Phycisphaerae bacterium]